MIIPRIKSIRPIEKYKILVAFDDDQKVIYDVEDDINTIKDFEPLKTVYGLFEQVNLDTSRTVVYWNDRIDIPSDTILEYGVKI